MALLHQRGVFTNTHRPLSAPRLPCRKLSCKAQKEDQSEESFKSAKGIAAAALAASFILASAGAGPAEAARSGGRTGGSSFRSAPRAAAPRNNNSVTNKTYNYNVSPSPPIGGGFGGFGGFGGGYGYGFGGPGISFFPTFVTPIGGGGGIFQFLIVAIIASTLLGAVRALFSGRRRNDYDD